LTGGTDGRILFWDCDIQDHVKILTDPNRMKVTSLHISPSGRYLATCGEDCHVKVYHLQEDALMACALGHSDMVNHLTWSPDERQVATIFPRT